MSVIDRDLAAALKQAKSKDMSFVLMSKAPGEGRSIVSKDRIQISAIDEAKRPTNSPKTPSVNLAAAEYSKVSEKVGRLSKIGSRFAQEIKIVASRGVRGMLAAVATLLRGLEAIDGAESALKAGGFIFQDQVARTNSLASEVAGMVRAYRDAGYHQDLDKMIALAREIDKENPDALFGSDALATLCASVDDDVAKHEGECQKLLHELRETHRRVSAGLQLIERVWNDPVFFAAAVITKDDTRLYRAGQDFDKMSRALVGPIVELKSHLAFVQSDLKRIKAAMGPEVFLSDSACGSV